MDKRRVINLVIGASVLEKYPRAVNRIKADLDALGDAIWRELVITGPWESDYHPNMLASRAYLKTQLLIVGVPFSEHELKGRPLEYFITEKITEDDLVTLVTSAENNWKSGIEKDGIAPWATSPNKSIRTSNLFNE